MIALLAPQTGSLLLDAPAFSFCFSLNKVLLHPSLRRLLFLSCPKGYPNSPSTKPGLKSVSGWMASGLVLNLLQASQIHTIPIQTQGFFETALHECPKVPRPLLGKYFSTNNTGWYIFSFQHMTQALHLPKQRLGYSNAHLAMPLMQSSRQHTPSTTLQP